MIKNSTSQNNIKEPLSGIIEDLNLWFEKNDFKYHSINSMPDFRLMNAIVEKYRYAGIAWRQFNRLSPINFRKWQKDVHIAENAMSNILLSYAYLLLYRYSGRKKYRSYMKKCYRKLFSNINDEEDCFSVNQSNRLFLTFYNASQNDISPLLTCWSGFLFIKMYRQFGHSNDLELALKVGNYFTKRHPIKSFKANQLYFYYVPTSDAVIYNCSAMISTFLLELGEITGNSKYLEKGEKGIRFIIENQNPDGSWFYGEKKSARYIDNFHTSFILISILKARCILNTKATQEAFNNGISYYKNRLFQNISETSVKPIRYDNRYFPLNSNCWQKVDLRDSAFSVLFYCMQNDLSQACRIVKWTNDEMKIGRNYAPEITKLFLNKIPYIEFQASIFLSLVVLQDRLGKLK